MSLGNALASLTFLPIPFRRQVPLAQSLHYFPMVGAALGSITVLAYLLADSVLPALGSCLVAVVLSEALGGWKFLRGLADSFSGKRTDFPQGFSTVFKPGLREIAVMTIALALKTAALFLLPPEWRIRAAFVVPILGRCAFTLACILGPVAEEGAGKSPFERRRIRAGILCVLLLMLVFQFPWRLALPAMALFTFLTLFGTRLASRKGRPGFQAMCVIAEVVEFSLLAGLAAGFWLLARS